MYNNQSTFNPYAQNVAIVKDYFKRPKVLFWGILHCLSLVATIISAMISTVKVNSGIANALVNYLDELGMYEQASSLETFFSSTIVSESIYSFISMAPTFIVSILTLVAIFMIYSKSKNVSPDSSPRGGIKILYIISLLQLIAAILSSAAMLFVVLFLCIILGIAQSNYDFSELGYSEVNFLFIAIAAMVVIVVVFVIIMLIFSISKLRYTKSLKNSVSSVTLSYKGAGGYGFSCILFAITELLVIIPCGFMAIFVPFFSVGGKLFNMNTASFIGPVLTVSCVSMLLTITLLFTEASVALGYKKYIKKIIRGYSNTPQPTYTQPQPAYNRVAYNEPITQTQQANTCPQCGANCKESDSFCIACGARIK